MDNYEYNVISEIMHTYDSSYTFFDVYRELLYESRRENTYSDELGVFEKWLWKYRDYTVDDFFDTN